MWSKSRSIAVILGTLVFGVSLASAQTDDPPQEPVQLTVEGVAYNVTANDSTGFSLRVTTAEDGSLVAALAFDNENLFGRFSGYGIVWDWWSCEAPSACYQFEGTFAVGGDDGSGWEVGTQSPMVLTVTFNGTQMRGVYHIEQMGSVHFDQYGILEGFVLSK